MNYAAVIVARIVISGCAVMCRSSRILLITLALSTISMAETYEYQLLYAEVPGIDKALAGDLDATIEVLESRAKNVDNPYVTDEQATLCGLYIEKGKLDAARRTCNAAVDIDQSDLAYNNRGVLRVHLGDTAGALEDFDRARVLPDNQRRYIEELMRTDARLVASSNYAVATEHTVKRDHPGQSLASRVRGASVEELSN